MRPRIGITIAPLLEAEKPDRYRINQAYVRAIEQAGGTPLLIPSASSRDTLRALYDALDGVLLPGGADLQPATYGANRHPTTDDGDAALDAAELLLSRWALDEAKPILGICRGQQCLNVAAGGSLYQDILSEIPDATSHRLEPRESTSHRIVVEPDSRLADLLGTTDIGVNSMHHQAVWRLAAGFIAVAHAADGIVEGIELPSHPFAIAVQFHPEELVPGHAACERLFQGFVRAASR